MLKRSRLQKKKKKKRSDSTLQRKNKDEGELQLIPCTTLLNLGIEVKVLNRQRDKNIYILRTTKVNMRLDNSLSPNCVIHAQTTRKNKRKGFSLRYV